MTSSAPSPLDLFADRYELYREIGEGSVAHTYLALEHGPLGLRRLTTVKLLKPDIHHDALRLERLFAAARRLAASDTPHLVEVRDIGAQGGEAFIATPYLVGENLLSILARCAQLGAPPPLPVALRIAADAAAGLCSLHAGPPETTGPLLHGALRPSNILVAHTGLSHVLDAGIAAKARTLMAEGGISPGVAQFTSPESLGERGISEGERDLTTDLYALGACLYALVTLRFPYDEMQLEALVAAKQGHAGVPARQRQGALPAGLESFLLRSLAPSPQLRPQSATEFADELRAIGDDRSSAIADHATVARWLRKVFGRPFADKVTFLRALVSTGSHALPSATQTQVQAPQAPAGSTEASQHGHESPGEPPLDPFGEDESLGDFDEGDTEMIVSKDDTTAVPPPDEQRPGKPFGATESDQVLFDQTIEVLIDMLSVEDENASATRSPSDPLLAPPDTPTDDSEDTSVAASTTADDVEGNTAITTVERIFSPGSSPETSSGSLERSARRLTPPPSEDTPAPEPEPAFFAESPPSRTNEGNLSSHPTAQSTWHTQKMEALRQPFTDDEDDEKTEVEP